jgi:hypothetical protein
MKTFGGVEVYLQTFLTLVLVLGGVFSVTPRWLRQNCNMFLLNIPPD